MSNEISISSDQVSSVFPWTKLLRVLRLTAVSPPHPPKNNNNKNNHQTHAHPTNLSTNISTKQNKHRQHNLRWMTDTFTDQYRREQWPATRPHDPWSAPAAARGEECGTLEEPLAWSPCWWEQRCLKTDKTIARKYDGVCMPAACFVSRTICIIEAGFYASCLQLYVCRCYCINCPYFVSVCRNKKKKGSTMFKFSQTEWVYDMLSITQRVPLCWSFHRNNEFMTRLASHKGFYE